MNSRQTCDGKIRPCEGCGNSDPWARHPKKEALTGRVYEECNKCFDSSVSSHPDVYCPSGGYWDAMLFDLDDPTFRPDKGLFVRSKEHKAYVLKKMGVREAGDAVNGRRNFDPISYRYGQESMRRYYDASIKK